MLKRTIIAAAAVALTSGCAAFQGATAPYVVKAVNRYCAEPVEVREVVRATVDSQLRDTGHTIRVNCAGD